MQRMMWVIAMVAALGVGSATAGQAPVPVPPSGPADAQGVVDVNSAIVVQLETLPGSDRERLSESSPIAVTRAASRRSRS